MADAWLVVILVAIFAALIVLILQGFQREPSLSDELANEQVLEIGRRLRNLETRQDPERYRDF